MLRPALVIAAAVTLASCQSTRLHSACPSLVSYSRATQAQAAKELRALPPGSTLERLLQDYRRTRDSCRAAGAK